jgi:hypothetical protein
LKIDEWKKLGFESELWSIMIKRDNFTNKVEFENLFEALLYLNNGGGGSQLPQVIFEILSPEKALNKIIDLYDDNKVNNFLDAILNISLKYPKDNVFGYLSNRTRAKLETKALMDFGARYLEGIIKNGDYKTIENIVSFATLDERNKDYSLKLDPNILGVFYSYVTQHPLEFITHCIREIKQTELFELYHFTEQLFGTYKKFEEFLYNQPETIQVLELKTFYRRFQANNYAPIEYTRGTIEIISSSETEFCGSEMYHNDIKRQKSEQFVHPTFQRRVEELYPIFRNVPWIAMSSQIDNKPEQYNGDTYTFKRRFNVENIDCLNSISLSLFVDDILITARINGVELFDKQIETSNDKIAICERGNNGLINEENEIVFLIRNKSLPELMSGNRQIDSVVPGENPYGIAYILELRYDMEKLKAEKVYELW